MALSSVSVVSNSLTLKFFKPGKRNWISTLAPAAMVLVFSFVFFEFAQFSSKMAEPNPVMAAATEISAEVTEEAKKLLLESPLYVTYADESTPKFFVQNTNGSIALPTLKGKTTLGKDEMIVGSKEAEMMIEEGLFEKPGDTLKNFFGVPEMKIVGILEPTGTFVDYSHVIASVTNVSSVARVEVKALEDELKFFYQTTPNNVPSAYRAVMKAEAFAPVIWGEKRYIPVFVGSSEAKVMQEEKLFTQVRDIIPNFFGRDAIIAGILPETKTPLDTFHYIAE